MKKRIMTCMLALAVVFSMTACGEEKKEEVTAERGTIEDNVYTNESMGVKLTLPEGCTLFSDEEIKQVIGNGADIMEEAGTDSEAVENSLSGTIYDVIAVTADQTANIQIIMEDTENTAGRALTAKEYSEVMINSLKTAYAGAGVEMGEAEITEETLGGMEFSKVSVSVNGMKQEYHTHQVGKYVLVFTVTYTETAAEAVQQFLDSVTAL